LSAHASKSGTLESSPEEEVAAFAAASQAAAEQTGSTIFREVAFGVGKKEEKQKNKK
jgi:hypothetical protein